MNGRYSPGDLLGSDYVVRLFLGEGGMGQVYLVEHATSGNLRAAKVIGGRDTASETDLIGFRKEAHALLNVGAHPFVVRLFQVQEQASDTVLLMEYVAPVSGCTTLRDYIAKTQDYNDRLISIWSVQFCVGMEHALRYALSAHRDVKPGNLLIDSGALLKIADFGLALAFSQYPTVTGNSPRTPSQLQQLTSADGRQICGTPGYIAPELFNGSPASPQSDMFSFGVTLWQLAARSLDSPYGIDFCADISEYENAILDRALSHAVKRIDSPYSGVIQRCLEPDPARRFPDFATLREAIKDAAKAANIKVMDFIVAPGFRGSLEDYVNRGRSYLILGRYERALRILNEAVKHAPESYEAQTARAEALIHRGGLLQAVQGYEAAHRLNPEADLPLTGMALAWLELGKPAQARAALDKVLAHHPANLDAVRLSARVLSEDGNNQAALDVVREVIAADPLDPRGYDCLGRVLWQLERPSDAATALRTCLHLNPLALTARLALAALLTGQKELAAAEAEYQSCIRLFHDSPEALNTIAAHMAENGHAKMAIALFQALADTAPAARSNILVNVGNAYLKLGAISSAASSYRLAIEADSSNAFAHSRLGDLEFDRACYDEATNLFARACSLDPQNPTYHSSAGTAFLQQQNYAQAATYLRRSLELFPEQPRIHYNLAVAVFGDGNAEAAIEQLAKAVCIDEEYARAWCLKARLEAHIDRAAEAAVSARRAVAISSGLSREELEELRVLCV